MEHSHEMREQWPSLLFAQTAPVPKIEPHFKRNIWNFSMFHVRFLFLSSWHISNHKSKNYLHNVALTWPADARRWTRVRCSVCCHLGKRLLQDQVLVLPPEKRMGKAPPDDVDSNWFHVVIAEWIHEYHERALPPEKMLRSVILETGKVIKFSQIAYGQSIDKCPPLLIMILQ